MDALTNLGDAVGHDFLRRIISSQFDYILSVLSGPRASEPRTPGNNPFSFK